MPENNIIDITPEIKTINTSEDVIKQIEKLNARLTDESGGEWISVPNYGIVWKPNSNTPETIVGGPPSEIPPAIQAIVQWGNTIDFDNITQNAVVLIKLGITDPMRANMLQRAIAKQVLEPRIEKLKEKRVCILFMQTGDDISVMTEAEMLQAGWERKEKSMIIIP